MKTRLTIATRKSPLALWQANFVKQAILVQWPLLEIELLPLTTIGDQFLRDKLITVGGKGLFVKELEEALLDGRADLAVHSMKDVPAFLPNGLTLGVICERHNPFDALVSQRYSSIESLPLNAIIGTSSLRRQSQLLALRPDLVPKTLRGNIQTRLNKLNTGEFDAIILAAAGLLRMGLSHHLTEILNTDVMLPACGQGALGIEYRDNDNQVEKLIAHLNDENTARCVSTERLVNAKLGGNCHVALAVFATIDEKHQIHINAKVLNEIGNQVIQAQYSGPKENAETLAHQCAQTLIDQGALQLLNTSPI